MIERENSHQRSKEETLDNSQLQARLVEIGNPDARKRGLYSVNSMGAPPRKRPHLDFEDLQDALNQSAPGAPHIPNQHLSLTSMMTCKWPTKVSRDWVAWSGIERLGKF